MNPSSSKNPLKKRRLDDIQESLPGPSSEVSPLVTPQLIKKSSKDPNRGMYPCPKGSRPNHFSHSSSPQFVKASELRRVAPQTVKTEKTKPVDAASKSTKSYDLCTDRHVAVENTLSTDFKSNSELVSSKKPLNLLNKVKGKHTFNRETLKITRFFNMSDPAKPQTLKPDCSGTISSKLTELNPSESAGTSGWKKKNPDIQDQLTEINNEQFFKSFRDRYGLVENSAHEEGEDYFRNLPTHIIETILCQIPILDLMACRLVCSRWHDIIDNRKFMEWKKLYYKFKRNIYTPIQVYKKQISDIVASVQFATVEKGIPALMKYMGKKFNRLPSSDMYELLRKNAKGELADQVLTERFPEMHGKEVRVWCQFALAILISETVWDIFDLYKSLFTSKCACSRPDVTDAMYCIATFLLYYASTQGINCGLHYRLYYALYLIENHIPTFQREKLKIARGLPGQQSIYSYSKNHCSFLTYEQIRVLNHRFDMNQKIKIIALAGTGKTTTLLQLSRLYPQIKFLNLVFNKSVNEEAKKKFPPNVTCKTAHSLAYAAVGNFLRHKLTTTLRPYDLIGHLNHNEDHIQIYAYANLVLTTINNFTVSSADAMSLMHVPRKDFNNHKLLSHVNRDRILMDAYKIWQKMIDRKDPFKITHDVYLKLYHLEKPNLHKYQCIMVDEAQDCNPVILDIVLSQTMPVIFVGDPNQQIYGFRGAQNALQTIKSTHTYHLTKSFRFGPEISYIASCVLELLLNSRKTTIVGSTNDSFVNGKVIGQYAVISRTNIVLFNEALRMIVFKRLKGNEPTVIKATFAGGINSYGFDQISDIYNLKNVARGDRQLTDKFISRFRTYTDLVNYARYSDDSDLLSKIEIVNQHGHDISKFITILKERCNHPMELANVVFSTAHKAKGLEFDSVYLTDDYPISTGPGYLEGELSREEANIFYVALTRAKKCLLLPEKITKVLYLAFEKFEYPVSSKAVLQDKSSLRCVLCNDSFTPHTVLMFMRRKFKMATEREIEEGPLCMKCGSDPYMRPDVHMNGLIMYLDPTSDNSHRFMSSIVGPLPNDPPIIHDRFSEFHNADRVFVINLNIH